MAVAAEMGRLLAFPGEAIPVFWPPAGLLAAALLCTPERSWPAVLGVALPGSLLSAILHGLPLGQGAWLVAGDALAAGVTAALFRRWVSRRADLARIPDALGFVAIALGVGAPVGALVAARAAAGDADAGRFASDAARWWAASGIGVVVCAPAWLARRTQPDPKERARWRREGPLALLALATVCELVFGPDATAGTTTRFSFPYLILPVVIWLALRLRLRGASAAMVVVALFTSWHTTHGDGPFAAPGVSPAARAGLLQGFLGVVAGTALGLAASARERVTAEQRLRRSEERLRQLFDGVHDLIQVTTPSGHFELVNRAWLEALGHRREDLARLTLDDIVEPTSRDACRALVARILGGEDVGVIELLLRTRGGAPLPVEGRASPRIEGGQPLMLRWVLRDVTHRKRLEESQREETRRLERAYHDLAEIALSDPLTGLRNRRAFEEDLQREAPRADREGAALSLLIVDVDHFKAFNDRFGHPAGDDALRAVARLLREHARRSDSVARIGGEEFAVLLPDTDVEGALALAERFRAAVERHEWPDRAVTVSIGVATVRQASGDTAAALVREADRALYRSKSGGRNRVTHAERDGAPVC